MTEYWMGIGKTPKGRVWHALYPLDFGVALCNPYMLLEETTFQFGKPTCRNCLKELDRLHFGSLPDFPDDPAV